MAATQHLAIKPKSDILLFYCLAHWLIAHDFLDHEFIKASTTGFDDFRDSARDCDPADHLQDLGLSLEEFDKFAAAIARGKQVSFWWTMGGTKGIRPPARRRPSSMSP